MTNFWKNVIFLARNRFIIFAIFSAALLIIQFFFVGKFFPSTDTKNLWFYSGIFMILFSILFIEPYYTSPKNVITNTVPLLLVLLAIKASFNNIFVWWAAVVVLISLLFASIGALTVEDKDKSPDYWKNKTAGALKTIVVIIGQGRVLYSLVFLYFLLTYQSIQHAHTVTLFVLWFIILSVNPKHIHGHFSVLSRKKDSNRLGEIFGVQSKKIFLVKLYEDRTSIKKYDVVKFKYSMQDAGDLTIRGIVFDTYLLNQEKWAKVLQLGDVRKDGTKLEKNILYKISDRDEISTVSKELNIDNLVGIVIDGSTIGKVKFEYSKRKDDLQEGDLLELNVADKRLFYQVIGGNTEKERLEDRNETGFIEGEAIQLGEWQSNTLSFQKFGWVPSINTVLFKADTSNIEVPSFKYPLYQLGVIPGTSLPSVINLGEAVSHHMALLGVTGSGKTFLAREVIRHLSVDTKIICVDLTGEWIKEIESLKPQQLIDKTGLASIEETIAEKAVKTGTKNSVEVLKYKKKIQDKLSDYIKAFAESSNNITIFELPDLSNTSFILELTQMFLEGIFLYAKEHPGNNFCIVLEEAHTIVPETTFLGDLGDYSSNKGLVSKMGQIALQGRKFGVGLLVIAQRTANVSKTVLTQCNTVVCFQAFDETSFTFLGNYVGKDMVQALPNLKQYHAIIAGKAAKSNMPMIVDLSR